ncbi:hypothetical protein IM511_09305 [Erythrobacteraceae bacterium E2-1 Yellow Sea]|nr:hypothetical protein [Erythrobacteraceae bacterium E2-1 Yellow Sea]
MTSADTLAGSSPVWHKPVGASQSDLRTIIWQMMPALVLFYSALLPQEMRLEIAGLAIYPYRFATLALFPWIIRMIVSGRLRFSVADLLMVAGSAWILISFIVFYGPSAGMIRGGALVMDLLPAYLVGRSCIQNLTDLRRFLVLVAPGALLAGATMFAETLAQRALVRPFFANIFGSLPAYENGTAVGPARGFTDVRLGLLRVAGPFSHPILAGLFLASLLPLYVMSGIRKWPFYFGLCAGICAIFSISSAVFLVLIYFVTMTGYDWLQKRVEILTWWRFIFAGIGLALLLEVASKNGLISVIIRYTLSPATGAYRTLTWDFGLNSVRAHPWFGIAYTDYERAFWMPNSVDAEWLLLALRHGIPMVVFILLAALIVLAKVALKVPHMDKVDGKFALGLVIALSSILLAGFTVAFFGGFQTWFYMLLGGATSFAFTQRDSLSGK